MKSNYLLCFLFIINEISIAQIPAHHLPDPGLVLPDTTKIKILKDESGNIDKLIEGQISNSDEMTELMKMDSEASKIEGLLKSVNSINNRMLMESLKNRKNFERLVSEMKENELIGKVTEHLTSAREKLEKLKKKYAYLPSNTTPSEGIKTNFLEDEPFVKRLVPGCDISMVSMDPFAADIAPSLGYQCNEKFRTGLKADLRIAFVSPVNNNPSIPEKIAGFGFYLSHKIFKGIFVQTEYESVFHEQPDRDNHKSITRTDEILAGIGNEYRIAKGVKGTVALFYNTLHSDQSPRPNPWHLKFGVNLR